MTELSIAPTPVYSFRFPRVGYWQLPVVSLCPPTMDGKKYFPPALSHTRFLEHFSNHSDAISVFTDGSKSDADRQPYCDDCLVPLTVRHLLVECPSLMDLRHRYLCRRRSRDNGVYYLSKVLGPACLAPGHDVIAVLALEIKVIKCSGEVLVKGHKEK
ncbi:hypothetical protein E2C01_031786 [Portunus trituberculatus]|uniref:Uncharacterized protein n=1 Tax=Portunus trituberculatus TaxID=210409 RepID=A0A5B7ETQ1_PORTR|nr:hypothetical protein [Portunus trituberculatus]